MKKFLCIIFATVFCFSVCLVKTKSVGALPQISAKSAVVLECTTNSVLYSKNESEKLPMASTTKVMTAIVAIEKGKLDDMVTTCDEAYGVEGSSIYLKKNEEMSLSDLLYGLMLRSGNDAAVAIAHHIGGSVDNFVAMMNEKAKEIGAKNTHFTNPNGLPDDEHYTTAYDLALICSYAMKNDTFKEIAKTQYHTAQTGSVKRTMMNKNKLLWQYEGAIGIKTGYTIKAGKCLTFAAERNGMTIVGCELACPDMFPDSMTLMNFAFDNYELYTLIKKDSVIMRMGVDNSRKLCTLVSDRDVCVPVKKDKGCSIKTSIHIADKLSAPLYAGQTAGYVELYDGDDLVGRCDIIVHEDMNADTYSYFFNRVVQGLFG